MIARKQEVVDQTVAGVDFLMEKNGITVLNGFGSFVDAQTLEVKKDGGETEQIKADRILIATGSEPASLPFIQLDGDRVITSTEALELLALPERMVIIGGGVIGLELGWSTPASAPKSTWWSTRTPSSRRWTARWARSSSAP